jgi:hypothetical protein
MIARKKVFDTGVRKLGGNIPVVQSCASYGAVQVVCGSTGQKLKPIVLNRESGVASFRARSGMVIVQIEVVSPGRTRRVRVLRIESLDDGGIRTSIRYDGAGVEDPLFPEKLSDVVNEATHAQEGDFVWMTM